MLCGSTHVDLYLCEHLCQFVQKFFITPCNFIQIDTVDNCETLFSDLIFFSLDAQYITTASWNHAACVLELGRLSSDKIFQQIFA